MLSHQSSRRLLFFKASTSLPTVFQVPTMMSTCKQRLTSRHISDNRTVLANNGKSFLRSAQLHWHTSNL